MIIVAEFLISSSPSRFPIADRKETEGEWTLVQRKREREPCVCGKQRFTGPRGWSMNVSKISVDTLWPADGLSRIVASRPRFGEIPYRAVVTVTLEALRFEIKANGEVHGVHEQNLLILFYIDVWRCI